MEPLAVAAWSMLTPFGEAFGPTALKFLFIYNSGTTDLTVAGTLLILGTSSPSQTLCAGGVLMKAAPGTAHTVTGGSTDTLTITNQSGSTAGAYTLVLGGVSAGGGGS